MVRVLRIGTRGSALARWQSAHVADQLQQHGPALRIELQVIETRGDRILDTPLPLIGGKGLFTEALERTLLSGEIDLAVHSLKDLPTEPVRGLTVGAIPRRADPRDVLFSREGHTFDTLPEGATIGTSSRRRAAQLRHLRHDLCIADLRGNVDTRLRKAADPEQGYDAIVLAHAGLERLGRLDAISETLSPRQMLPAPGQGALAVQCRADDHELLGWLQRLHHVPTAVAVAAERGFLAALGSGCALPVAALATLSDGRLRLVGRVLSVDGTTMIERSGETCSHDEPEARLLGTALAEEALRAGAAELLAALP